MKPKLKDGYKWGSPLAWKDVKVGDHFFFAGSRARGATGGKIIKINRVTFVYETIYMNRPMEIKTRKDDFYGGDFHISRGKVVHELND